MTPASSPVDILQWQRTVAALNILTAAEQAVADALSRRINSQTGKAWPSLKTLAADVGKSASVAKRTVRKLARAGLLAIRRTGRGSIYRLLRWVRADPSDRPAATPKRAKGTIEVLPLTPRGEESITITSTEATPEAQSEPESALETQTPAIASPEPESASEARTDPADEALAVIVALIAASGAKYSTKPGSGPMRSAERALRVATVEDLKLVISWCAATWSNPKFLTPSAVLKPSKLEERIAAAKASAPAGTRAACHKPFEPDKPIERTPPDKARSHLAAILSAIGG